MNITFANAIRSASDGTKSFVEALLATGRGSSRTERGLAPYQSPKKSWDPRIAVEPEVLVEVAPSLRAHRRGRRRDLEAMGRKSRAKARRNAFQQAQARANLVGQARVYLEGAGTPAMQQTVLAEVHDLATRISAEQGEPYTASLKRAEGSLLQVLTEARG